MPTTENEMEQIATELRVEATRQGAFARLAEHFTEPLFWHIRRLLVVREETEDAVQETFVKAFTHLEDFRGGGRELRAWLYRIATNTAIGCLRRRRRGIFTSLDSVGRELQELLADECGPTADQELVRFQQILLALPLKQRLVFNLRYYDELPYAEIARITGSRQQSLKTNYHYAVKRIRKELTE